ncbi:MAG TPA: hypothetical protein VK928_06995, partial [Longimicrobiales bacterium]|nr:hypothetical protein [Longimicrobiales bacterium]
MRTRHLSLIPFLALAQGAVAQEPDRYAIAGATVAVYNLAGAVTIERGSGDNVVVEVTRSGRDAGRLRVERMEVNGRAALVVRYPGDDVVYDELGRGSRTSMYVRRDGTFFGSGDRGDRITIRGSGGGTEAHADLRILVPAGRSVDVRLG